MNTLENLKPEAKKRKKVVSLDQGRVPPQAIDLEEAVLGALLIDNTAVGDVLDILSPNNFYKENNKIIFDTITKLFADSLPVDILTVSEALRKNGQHEVVGGDYYLVYLTQKVASAAHIEYHARVIVEKSIQRDIISIAGELIEDAFDETSDVLELLDRSEQRLFDITSGNIKKNFESSSDLVKQALEHIRDISNKEGVSGVPSGFNGIDKITGGWQNSDLIIIAARPGMGKTAFVLSMARSVSIKYNVPIAIFSLEMSSVQLITRMISSETQISSEDLRKGKLTNAQWQELTRKVDKLEKAPIYIDDTPSISIFDLRAKCRRLKSTKDIQLIVIDYLQLMTAGQGNKGVGNREQEISTISRSLKAIAKELNVPVIALSQVNRGVETRAGGSKRPMLSDLRESGAIEQDADIVSFIYRPEYYEIDQWEDGSSCLKQAEFIIAKHRNGSLDNVRLKFIGQFAQFDDLEISSGQEYFTYESKLNENSGNSGFPNTSPFDNSGLQNDFGLPKIPTNNEFYSSKSNDDNIFPGDEDEDDDLPFS
jgi:replicative DNA helicase